MAKTTARSPYKTKLGTVPRGYLIFVDGCNCFVRFQNRKVMKRFKKDIIKKYPEVRHSIKKQTKWREDKHTVKGVPLVLKVEIPRVDAASEMINIKSKSIVKFHNRRDFRCAVSYQIELSNVARSVPADFKKFYLFVAEYQRVSGFSPMSFIHFLAAWNTNRLEEFLILYTTGYNNSS